MGPGNANPKRNRSFGAPSPGEGGPVPQPQRLRSEPGSGRLRPLKRTAVLTRTIAETLTDPIPPLPVPKLPNLTPLAPPGRDDGLQVDSRRAFGPFAAASRALGRRFEDRIPMTTEDRTRIISALYPEGKKFRPFARRFGVLMGIAVSIAVFGLVADSTAVVIGAMLVAPLLTPILGLSAAIIMGWPGRVVRYAVLVAVSSAGSIAFAFVLGMAIRLDLNPLPGELLARTQPNMLDLGIALAAGTAGAFAVVRRQAADAMSGAAVAVALVPPLSSVGILAQQGEFELAVGALLLFLTNVAGVVMSGAITFVASGFVPGVQLLYGARRTVGRLRWIALAVVLVVAVLQLDRPGMIQAVPAFEQIEGIVAEWKGGPESSIEIVDLVVDVVDGQAAVDLVIAASTEPPAVATLAEVLSDQLNRPVEVNLQILPARSSSASADE